MSLTSDKLGIILPTIKCLGSLLSSNDNKLIFWIKDNGFVKVA